MAEEIRIDDRRGFIARPTAAKGGVVVVHEIHGLTPHFAELCDRLAGRGFVAAAPELFGGGDLVSAAVSRGDISSALGAIYDLGPDRWLTDLRSAVAQLRRGDPDLPIAVVGFCFGGFLTLLAAEQQNAPWSAAVAFYGPPDGYAAFGAPEQPRPIDGAGSLACPLLMVYGTEDEMIPVERAEAFARAASTSGQEVQVVTANAGHAFFNDTRDSYAPAAAADAWTSLVEFLERYLTVTERRSGGASNEA